MKGSPPLRRSTRRPARALVDHHLVDAVLGDGVPVALLADIDALGRRRQQRQYLRRYEVVVEHEIRLPQQARRTYGQQLGVAGTGTHQDDFARPRFGRQRGDGGRHGRMAPCHAGGGAARSRSMAELSRVSPMKSTTSSVAAITAVVYQ